MKNKMFMLLSLILLSVPTVASAESLLISKGLPADVLEGRPGDNNSIPFSTLKMVQNKNTKVIPAGVMIVRVDEFHKNIRGKGGITKKMSLGLT